MTVAEFASRYNLPIDVVREVFGLRNDSERGKSVASFGLSESELLKRTNRALALGQEYASKNWFKIPIKFALWMLLLAVVFILFRKSLISGKTRIFIYGAAVALFGVLFGSDPSPMGTVKDAVVLYGKSGAVFPPRMIALTVFILLTVGANKFICSWGCQFGTLQDLLFRINRNSSDTKGIFRQIRLPFVVTNGIRIVFFVFFTLMAVMYAFDAVEIIDPFKIFNPAMIGISGGIFIAMILVASPFVYRPWCHLFCPFGLVSWVFEKISLYKIQVDYDTCIACEKCAKACPSHVMGAILKRDSLIPDCFACGTCINACPTGSVQIRRGTRALPPVNKFKKQ